LLIYAVEHYIEIKGYLNEDKVTLYKCFVMSLGSTPFKLSQEYGIDCLIHTVSLIHISFAVCYFSEVVAQSWQNEVYMQLWDYYFFTADI